MRPVLMFHDIAREPNPRDPFSVTERLFLRIVELVSSHDREHQPSEKALLTFDDGYLSHYATVFPSLRSAGLTGLFFVIPSLAGDSRLNAEQIREMVAGGMIIGSHTLTHANLGVAGPNIVRTELMESKSRISRMSGTECTELALPGGMSRRSVFEIAQDCGYSHVHTSVPSFWDGQSPVVPRLCIRGATPLASVQHFLSRKPSSYLVAERVKAAARAALGPCIYPAARELLRRGTA